VITHPDDLHEFRKQLRELGARIGAKVTGESIAVEQEVSRRMAKELSTAP